MSSVDQALAGSSTYKRLLAEAKSEKAGSKEIGAMLRVMAEQTDEIAALTDKMAEQEKRTTEILDTVAKGFASLAKQGDQSDAILAALVDLKSAMKLPEPPEIDVSPMVKAIDALRAVMLAPVELETTKDGTKRARRKMEKV